MNIITGHLDPFSETGTEGIIWSVYESGKQGYDGLHCMEYGDYLTIYDRTDTAKVVWEGNIDYEWERNYHPFPTNPDSGQQEIGGMWVHGIQQNVEPSVWGDWFFEKYPATLIKAGFGHFYPLKSSTLAAYSYSGRSSYVADKPDIPGALIVKFKNGSYYRYKDVEPTVFWKFYESESKGAFLAQNIKKKYEFEKLEVPNTKGK